MLTRLSRVVIFTAPLDIQASVAVKSLRRNPTNATLNTSASLR